jgi:peroxiredoxin Q/BCP
LTWHRKHLHSQAKRVALAPGLEHDGQEVEKKRAIVVRVKRHEAPASLAAKQAVEDFQVGGLPAERWPKVNELDSDFTGGKVELQGDATTLSCAAMKEGDKVPSGLLHTSFEAVVDSEGAPCTVALADLVPKGKTLVLFFYPKDSTPGCTREAQAFSTAKRTIEKLGGVVVGVSRDSAKSHTSFRAKYELDIPLLSDPDRILHEGFGAWGEKTMYGKTVLGAIRSTFLIKDGKVLRAWSKVKVDGHVDDVVAALRT